MRAVVSLSVAALAATMLIPAYADAPITSIGDSSVVTSAAPVIADSTEMNSSVDSTSSTTVVSDNSDSASSNSVSMGGSRSDSQRIGRLENQLQYVSSQLNQLQSLQQDVMTMKGQEEQLSHRISLLEQNQKALSASMQRSMQAQKLSVKKNANNANIQVSAAPAVTVDAAAPDAAKPAAPSLAETQAFQNAYNLMTNKQYADSIDAFKTFVKTYPHSTQLADAYYWLGQMYLAQGQAELATQEFRQVIDLDPKSTKAPDAMLKLGTIYLTNGDAEHAKQMFKRVAADFKGTPYGDTAAKQLQSMQ